MRRIILAVTLALLVIPGRAWSQVLPNGRMALLLGAGDVASALAQSLPAELPRVRIIDGVKFPQSGEGIQAALNELGPGGNGILFLPPGKYNVVQPIVVSAGAISIVGAGSATRIMVNDPTINVFQITGHYFRLESVLIQAIVRKTAGSVLNVGGAHGTVRNIRMTGSFYNGFTHMETASGDWSYDNVMVDGGPGVIWNRLFFLQASTHTVSSFQVRNLRFGHHATFVVAGIILDTGVDCFTVSDSECPTVLVQNTLGGIAPRWIHFINSSIEAGLSGVISGTAIKLEATRDFTYQGHIATSQVAVDIGAGARDVDISHTMMVHIGRQGIHIATGADDVVISHNTFDEVGLEANDSFDAILVESNVNNFKIEGNHIHGGSSNLPAYGIHILRGESDNFIVSNNTASNIMRQVVRDESTGTNKSIQGNLATRLGSRQR